MNYGLIETPKIVQVQVMNNTTWTLIINRYNNIVFMSNEETGECYQFAGYGDKSCKLTQNGCDAIARYMQAMHLTDSDKSLVAVFDEIMEITR